MMMPTFATRREPRRMRGNQPAIPGDEQIRAVCGCGYPTSWVADRIAALALYQQHRVVHRVAV